MSGSMNGMGVRAYTDRACGQGKSRVDPERESASLEEGECLVVAAAIEIVPELRVDGRWELLLECGDLLGDCTQAIEVTGGVAGIPFTICNDGEPLPKGGDEGLLNGRLDGHAGNTTVGWAAV